MRFLHQFIARFRKKPVSEKVAPASVPSAANLEEVYVFPLPNLVLFPGVSLPLHIFEDRYKIMTEDLIKSDKLLAMSLASPAKDGHMEPHVVCGAGRIHIEEKFPDGCANIVVEGSKRIRIVKYVQEKPYLKALGQVVPDIPYGTLSAEQDAHDELSHLAARYIFLSPDLQDHFIDYLSLFNRPHYLADFIGYHFLPTPKAKQALLEKSSHEDRVNVIITFLKDQVSSLEQEGVARFDDARPISRTVH